MEKLIINRNEGRHKTEKFITLQTMKDSMVKVKFIIMET